jgi:hypothetical protein
MKAVIGAKREAMADSDLNGPFGNVTLRHIGWLIFLLSALFVIVWFAPPTHVFQGLSRYLPLHSFMETFAIVVAVLVFGIGWNAYSVERPINIVLLSCAFLAVGLLDFAHMLSYAGMPDFVTISGPQKAIDFWLAARFLAAVALLSAALLPCLFPSSGCAMWCWQSVWALPCWSTGSFFSMKAICRQPLSPEKD